MVIEVEELEPSTLAPLLTAQQYRRCWLDTSAELGQVAETLALALGWQPSADQPLPDALGLAQAASERITAIEVAAVYALIKQGTRPIGIPTT